jgi:hypothetical protein
MYGGLMSGKKRKYFSNNWRKIKDLPDKFIPQLEYEDVLEKNRFNARKRVSIVLNQCRTHMTLQSALMRSLVL